MEKKTKKTKKLPKVKVEVKAEFDITALLYKIIAVCPAKKLVQLMGMVYLQENISYATTTLSLLATEKNAKDMEAAMALSYLVKNWDKAVKEGGKIIGKALNNTK